jgi:hypothetical protein
MTENNNVVLAHLVLKKVFSYCNESDRDAIFRVSKQFRACYKFVAPRSAYQKCALAKNEHLANLLWAEMCELDIDKSSLFHAACIGDFVSHVRELVEQYSKNLWKKSLLAAAYKSVRVLRFLQLRATLRDPYDFFISCLSERAIQCAFIHPVRLQFSLDEFSRVDLNYVVDSVKHETYHFGIETTFHFQSYLRLYEKFDWDTIVYPQSNLRVFSQQTGNTDSRSGSYCAYRAALPVEEFVWDAHAPNGISLKLLVEGIYRMKGSKYDFWYELFHDIIVRERSADRLVIETMWGYGS